MENKKICENKNAGFSRMCVEPFLCRDTSRRVPVKKKITLTSLSVQEEATGKKGKQCKSKMH